MEYINPSLLHGGKSPFDVFTDSPVPDRTLVERGLTPPVVVRENDVIWGFGLLRRAAELRIEAVPAVRNAMTDLESVEIMLRMEGRTDLYSFEEKAGLVALIESLGIDVIPDSIRELVQSTGSFVEQAEKYTRLPDSCRLLVRDGRIALKHASRLNRLPEGVWQGLARRPGLTASELRLIATQIDEIARRDDLDAPACIELSARILSDSNPLDAVRRIRFPRLSEMERRFDELVSGAVGSTGVRITAPLDFEGDTYTVTFGFRSRDELTRRLSAAGRIGDISDGLFELL